MPVIAEQDVGPVQPEALYYAGVHDGCATGIINWITQTGTVSGPPNNADWQSFSEYCMIVQDSMIDDKNFEYRLQTPYGEEWYWEE